MRTMLEPGRRAPSFSLPDQDGNVVSLADQRGRWVVLYFYPRDDTPGCTVEACEFTALLPDFRALDAVVFGCSSDSASAHTKFINKHRLGVTLLTDADRKVMRAYGAFGKKKMYGREVEGVIRSTALIGPDGVLAAHWPTVRAAGHAEQVRARLAELQGGGAAPKSAAARSTRSRAATKAKPAAKSKPKVQPPKPKARAARPAAAAKSRTANRTGRAAAARRRT